MTSLDQFYSYPISEAEFHDQDDHDLGWYATMARRKKWQRLTLGRTLPDDDPERDRKLRLATATLIPLWARAISGEWAEKSDAYRSTYSLVSRSIERPDAEWQEIVDLALDGGIDYMLTNLFDDGVPMYAILGR